MILRRFGRAIREQKWRAVVLEVAIVVVGIFMGLQADDWNQRRLERESDRRALALFIDELELMLVEADDDVRVVNAFMHDLTVGTEIALRCDASDEERAELANAIGSTLHWRIPDIWPSGLADIGNSGTLGRLGNPELSRAVGSVNASIRGMDDSMEWIISQYDRAYGMLLPYMMLTAPIEHERLDVGVQREAPSEYLALAPQDTLCRSQEFLLGLSLLTSFHESLVYNFESWHRALSRAHELAEEEIR